MRALLNAEQCEAELAALDQYGPMAVGLSASEWMVVVGVMNVAWHSPVMAGYPSEYREAIAEVARRVGQVFPKDAVEIQKALNGGFQKEE